MSSSAKILVVESHTDTRYAVSLILAGAGYQVDVAGTAQEAIEFCREKNFDLLIGDLNLPNGAGFELLRLVASHCTCKHIAYTGYGRPESFATPAGDSTPPYRPIEPTSILEGVARELQIASNRR